MSHDMVTALRAIHLRSASQYQEAAIDARNEGDFTFAAQIARDARRHLLIANAADPNAVLNRLDGTFGT